MCCQSCMALLGTKVTILFLIVVDDLWWCIFWWCIHYIVSGTNRVGNPQVRVAHSGVIPRYALASLLLRLLCRPSSLSCWYLGPSSISACLSAISCGMVWGSILQARSWRWAWGRVEALASWLTVLDGLGPAGRLSASSQGSYRTAQHNAARNAALCSVCAPYCYASSQLNTEYTSAHKASMAMMLHSSNRRPCNNDWPA